MWMDYKNYLEEYDNKHFHVLDAYMWQFSFIFSDKRFVSTILFL